MWSPRWSLGIGLVLPIYCQSCRLGEYCQGIPADCVWIIWIIYNMYIYIYMAINNTKWYNIKKIQTLLSLCIKHHGQMLLLLWPGFSTPPKNLHDGSGLPQFKAAELLCSTDLPMGSGRARIVQQGWAVGRFSQRQQTCVFFGAIWYIYLQDTIW